MRNAWLSGVVGCLFVVGCQQPCSDDRCSGQLVIEVEPDGTILADILNPGPTLPDEFYLETIDCRPNGSESVVVLWSARELEPTDWPLVLTEAPPVADGWSGGAPAEPFEPETRYSANAWHDQSLPYWIQPTIFADDWGFEFYGDAHEDRLGHCLDLR